MTNKFWWFCVFVSIFSFNLKIAGGSGITPMLQVIDTIVKNPEDNTKVTSLLLPYFFFSKMIIYIPHNEVCNLSIQIAELLRTPVTGFFTQILKKLLSSFTAHLKPSFHTRYPNMEIYNLFVCTDNIALCQCFSGWYTSQAKAGCTSGKPPKS